MNEKNKIHVLVIDDSAVVRQVLTSVFSEDGRIEVMVAADPIFAMRKMERTTPDVIILDIEMPRMDGMTFLRKIMKERPIPIVICSSHVDQGTDIALRALEEGAIEVIAKPRVGIQGFLHETAVQLIDTVIAASRSKLATKTRSHQQIKGGKLTADVILPRLATFAPRSLTEKVVAVGASTGGTEAIRTILEAMPIDCPGIVIAQHMPSGFTRAFAERLNQVCRIEVKEAKNGDEVRYGRALVAPGDYHLLLQRSGIHYNVKVASGPLVSRHRPSVDVLFRSVAQAAGANATGIILTGMGDDGASGLLEMKQAGAVTVAQNEETCVVFGMPKEAISLNAVDKIMPLQQIPMTILSHNL